MVGVQQRVEGLGVHECGHLPEVLRQVSVVLDADVVQARAKAPDRPERALAVFGHPVRSQGGLDGLPDQVATDVACWEAFRWSPRACSSVS